MYFQQIQIAGEDFVGLLGMACDKYALLSKNFPKTNVFQVPIHKTKIYGTQLVGLFCAGNSNGLLLPFFTSHEKIKDLTKFLEGLGVNYGIIADKHTAIGNLVACNDKAALVSPKIGDSSLIEDVLGVEVVQEELYGGHEEVGSCLCVTNKGLLAHPDAEKKLEWLRGFFKVEEARIGSVNFGFPFVKSGMIANSNGYVTGRATSGIEMGRIDEALGFL
ncbi:translation initiation factor IF-6 [Candidatus Altiarchaeota archaeon]